MYVIYFIVIIISGGWGSLALLNKYSLDICIGMKIVRSSGGKHQHLALTLTQLREFLRNEYKPPNLSELKQGIKAFWESLTPEICSRYIGHLKKVIPKVV